MTRMTLLLLFNFLFISAIFAGDSTIHLRLKPLNFIPSYRLLEGMIGNENVIEYENPCADIDEPRHLFKVDGFGYTKLLESGIKSLLFEYKNYKGMSSLASYSLFANGNYSVIDQSFLNIANKYFFGNRKRLLSVYQWAIPYYKDAFSLLTVEEQLVQKNNLLIAEKYVDMILVQKNKQAFKKWLKQTGLQEDEKVTGFLLRRINKRQWTTDDCKFWINKLKADFFPLIKDFKNAAAHYQITDTLNNALYIAINHTGNFTVVNESYQPVIKDYALILEDRDMLFAYRSNRESDYRVYSLSEYSEQGCFKELLFDHWNTSKSITDSSYLFTTANYGGIYDNKNKKYLMDSCFFISLLSNKKFLICNYSKWSDSSYIICNLEGKRIGNQDVQVDTLMNFDASLMYSFYIDIYDQSNLITFRNYQKKNGVIDFSGKEIVPFKYDWIQIDELTGKIKCGYFSEENKQEDIYIF